MAKDSIEGRLSTLERDMNWARPLITEISKQLDIIRPRLNPAKYCRDTLDKKIVNYLIDNLGAGTTEIAKGVGLESPEKVGRHVVGKRLKRLSKTLSAQGSFILTFDSAIRENPVTHEKKYRAWWLSIEDVDVEAFKEAMGEL